MTALQDLNIRRTRWAVLAMFFVNGALFAAWVSRIPAIQQKLAIGEGALGVLLLGMSVGVLTALSLAGNLIERFSSRTLTTAAGLLLATWLMSLALLPNTVSLWMGLFIYGMLMSFMDVSMNSQASMVEQAANRPMMSSFHASWSIGGAIGAAAGGGLVTLGVAPLPHFALMTLLAIPVVLWASRSLLDDPPPTGLRDPSMVRLPDRVLWPLGAVAFCSALGEGAMGDWSAVYLTNIVGAATNTAALGFAVFAAMMTVGRLSGDAITARFDQATVVRLGGLLATLGLLLSLIWPLVPTVLLGYAAAGLGLSIAIPMAFSAAGRIDGVAPGAGIAGVSIIGYAGFLAGPPLIGLLAEVTSLRVSLLVVALLISTLLVSASALKPANLRRASPANAD